MAALCRLQSALLTLNAHIAPAHKHRVQLKMRQAAMAASEAAALQLHFEISPAVPEIGSTAEAKLGWHVADTDDAPRLSATLRGPGQLD